MTGKPTPKTFALLRDLEQAVRNDPTKSAFLDSLGAQMGKEVEDRYRREGDRFASRYASLDPQDIAAVETVNINQELKATLIKEKTDRLSQYIRDTERPEDFDQVYERFVNAPQVAIDSIKTHDPEFQNALQFKWRKIEQQRLEEDRIRQLARSQIDYEERELRHQTERVERKENDEFYRAINEVGWEDFATRQDLWEGKIQKSYDRLNERYAEQKQLFEARLRIDPFGCDETCQAVQTQFLDQEVRHQREALGDDLERERKNIEAEKARYEKNNPLALKCTTPEACEAYCRANPQVAGCDWITRVVVRPTTEIITQPQCASGEYWNGTNCIADPYFRPPSKFIQCGGESYWDEAASVCRPTTRVASCAGVTGPDGTISYPSECTKDITYRCGEGSYWDSARQDCVRSGGEACGQGFYYDYISRRCESDKRSGCGANEFWNEETKACIPYKTHICPAMSYFPCPDGEYRESKQNENGCWVPGDCRAIEKQCPGEPVECQIGLVRTETLDNNGCRQYSECLPPICPMVLPRVCAPGETPLPPDKRNNPCSGWSCVLPAPKPKPICPAPPTGSCPADMHRETSVDAQGCQIDGPCIPDEPKESVCGNNICEAEESSTSCTADCGEPTACNANGICDSGESTGSCPSDCGSIDTCSNNGICESSENTTSCPSDCSPVPVCNGNGVCDSTESIASCPAECPIRPACGDGVCNGSETTTSCLNDCAPGENPLCNGSPSYCKTKAGCIGRESYWCSVYCSSTPCKDGGNLCGNGMCDPGETTAKCPADCTGVIVPLCTTTPSACATQVDCTSHGFFWCSESCQSAACSGSGCNNNGVCDSNENVASCAADCSSDTTTYCGTSGWHYDTAARSCVRDGVVCSAPKNCDSCRPSTATKWCQWSNDGCPVSCQTTTAGYCGNKVCDSGETATSCAADCAPVCNNNGSCDSGETTANCWADCSGITNSCNNNRVCDAGETTASCPSDCTGGANTACNGNGICDYGESTGSCPGDCSSRSACNNNGICDSNESSGSCVSDCGSNSCSAMPSMCTSRTTCEAHRFYWCETTYNCYSGSSSCASGSGSSSSRCPANWTWFDTSQSCVQDGVTCSNYSACSACPPGPTSASGQWCTYESNGCPQGCSGSSGSGSGSTTACNGNGTCDYGESSGSCPSDCSGSTGSSGGSTMTCSSAPSYCYSQSDCTSYGYVWCSNVNACYSSGSGCGTSSKLWRQRFKREFDTALSSAIKIMTIKISLGL